MFKIILKLILINFFFITSSFSATISDIKVLGNKRISKESVIMFSEIVIGEEYNENSINNSLKSLYSTNFFEDIKISLEGNTISIVVKENPIIKELNINGIKKSSFLKIIKENMILKERFSFSKFSLEKDINLIRNILKSNGYFFSTLESNFSLDEELNSITLNINIALGDKAKIDKIKFLGNKIFKDKKLLEIIASEEHKFWKIISNNVYLNQTLISLDKRLLENFYRDRGFYNVNISDSYAELSKKNSSFNLIYNIDANEKFTFRNFFLDLPPDYEENDFVNIKKIFDDNINKPYSYNIKNKILNEIEKIASMRLYDFIDVTVEEVVSKDNKLDLIFKVSDSKKFYVERVNINGNFTTFEEVIRNELTVDEGDPLNNVLYQKSINDIKSLRIFKTVESEIKDGTNEALKIIDINVEEQPTGEISIAAGYGTNGISSGGSINERNFAGKGINLSSSLELNEESIKGEIVYSKPNFAYTDNTLFTSAKSLTNDYLSIYGYETKEIGFSLGTEFEQYENLFFSPKIDFTIEELTTNSNASSNIKKQQGNYRDFYFNYGLRYDMRDNSFDTKEGYVVNFNQELPVVSENPELVNIMTFTNYKELNKESEMIGRASLYLKSVNSIDGNSVRISNRANIPYNRLRGFERGKIGPIDQTDYIGGNYVSSLNLSTTLPSLFPTIEILDFNYFIDIANIWGVDYDENLDNSKIRSSTGIGLNVITPVGPLSFSLTQPITKASTDKTETFRFNIGTTF